MANTNTTVESLYAEGQEISLKLTRPSTDTIKLDWAFPSDLQHTAGVLVLVSTKPLNPSNQPTDTAVYTASTSLSDPADTIGSNASAMVVASLDNTTTTSVTLTNAVPEQLYYASIHAMSSVRQYFTIGVFSYDIDNPLSATSKTPESTGNGDIPRSMDAPLDPAIGQVYYNPANNTVQMWSGALWMPAGTGTVVTGVALPSDATQGQFFYNTQTADLLIFNGSTWTKANTANPGVPMYEKPGVGTDGTPDERLALIKTLKLQLGWPMVCVELKEEHFDYAIDSALAEARQRTDNAYYKQFIFFTLIKGQQKYYLNDPVLGTNRSVDLVKIWRMQAMSNYLGNGTDVYNQTFLNQLGLTGNVDLTSMHLMANLSEELQRMFAGDLSFTWHESSRIMHIQRNIMRNEPVIIEAVMERTEQDLLVDRWLRNWLREWAHTKLLETLGYIRSKFGNLPGAGGGITLNGSELLSRADMKFEDLKRQINDFEIGNNSPEWSAPLLIG